jgi:hypothetical protein
VETQSEEVNRPAGVQTTHTKSRGELTIEGKTPTGFRIAYVIGDISIDGDAPSVETMKPILALFKDWELHAATDGAGKPTDVIETEDGVTRSIREEGSIVGNAMGYTLTKKTTRIITVTPAP